MKKPKQLSFLKTRRRLEHGGSRLKSHPKEKRPLSTREPIHLVMKSSKAVGRFSFSLPQNEEVLRETIREQAKKFGVKIYDLAVNHDHFHSVVTITTHELFHHFLRAISGLLAKRIFPGLHDVWDGRPFTRVACWGRAFGRLKAYLLKNRLEAFGFSTAEAKRRAREVYSRWEAVFGKNTS